MSVTPHASRHGFVDAAREAFDFLLGNPYRYRFELADEGGAWVRYVGDGVVVEVFYGRLSYELDVQISRAAVVEEVKRPYTLGDLMRVGDPEAARGYRSFAATTPDAVRRGTAVLAEKVRRYGDPALLGSTEFYELLAYAQADAVRVFGEEHSNRAARKRADRAWAGSDYQGVVAAYESLTSLSRVESQRLRIARRRLGVAE